MTIHTYPTSDIIEHDTETENCPCQPKIVAYGNNKHIIHNAFDDRESFEGIQEVQ